MNAGDRYGPYQIIRLIGRGAMGEVYLAHDFGTKRGVALKIVYKGPDPEDQDILDAERLGAELQKRLNGVDRRVVTVNTYGEIAGDLFIDMEFIDGEDLSALIARGPVNPGFAVHVARELCEMLENLRSFTTKIGNRQLHGVIHGDLKPRNVRIDKQNQIKVLDFGIAKALTHTHRYTTNMFASTAYCSPERLETQNMDTHSDLWSVGVLLYQMIAGRLPFDEPTKERLERRIRSFQPPGPLPSSCPEPLRRIVFKMLARNPARRYGTPLEASEDLARFQKGQPVLAEAFQPPDPFDSNATVRTTPPARETAADDRTVRSPRVPPPLPPAPRRSYRVPGCVAVAGAAFLIFLTFCFVQINFWNAAGQFKTDLQTERITNLDDAWTQYQSLNKRSHLPVFLWGAERALRKRLVSAADETISEYRNSDSPAVREPQWVQARNYLARALELSPDDNDIKARLRLCEAHIDHIDAGALRASARQKKLNEAVNKFVEAAELVKRWPDPYLGLASLYIYDLNDVEKAEDALKKAAHYGHPEGKREIAQLGDGYRRLADRLWRQSRGLVQMPNQERNYLEKARRDYMYAESLYEKAGLFGDAARNRLQAIQAEQRIEQRLSELDGNMVAQ
jgi:serine/threonine protein kinase